MTRTNGAPLQAVVSRLIQVILGWRGREIHMAGRESWTEIEPQGLTTWEVRRGFLYSVIETQKTDITLHDTDGKKNKLSIEVDRRVRGVQNHMRKRWELPVWIKVIVQRQDGKPFFTEDKARCIVATQYDPDLDPRPLVSIRIDASDRSYLLDDIGVDEESAMFIDTLSAKFGFQFAKLNRCQFSPDLHG
jgi:hypothetical protein